MHWRGVEWNRVDSSEGRRVDYSERVRALGFRWMIGHEQLKAVDSLADAVNRWSGNKALWMPVQAEDAFQFIQ